MLDPSALTGSQNSSSGKSVAETQSARSGQQLAGDLNQFLDMLVTQLKNQDPLNPMDPNEFTTQLVQFASVEQQIYQNQNLEDMVKLQKSSLLGTAVGYIGSQAEVSGTTLSLANGESKFTYDLSSRADNTTLSIADSAGKTVYFTDGETAAGKHEFTWDGKDNFGFPMDDGAYTLTVSSLDSKGNPVDVSTSVIGKVTGVSSSSSGQPELSIGAAQYSLDQVISIRGDDTSTATN